MNNKKQHIFHKGLEFEGLSTYRQEANSYKSIKSCLGKSSFFQFGLFT